MNKKDKFSPKGISNRIKAKGLQKLRWYCQLCQKQCRDQNGFKCHCESEAHIRNVQIFGQSPDSFINHYSAIFEKTFMQWMRTRFRNSRVHFNIVYQELIRDRHHIHMNSTRWTSLTGFVHYLGRTGLCKVEQTEKGLFLTYIDREADTIHKNAREKDREEGEAETAKKADEFLRKQLEQAYAHAPKAPEVAPTELCRNSGVRVAFAMGQQSAKARTAPAERPAPTAFSLARTGHANAKRQRASLSGTSVARQMMQEEQEQREAKAARQQAELARQRQEAGRVDVWLLPGIVVKVVDRELREYYKLKGMVKEVDEKEERALVEMLDTGDLLRIDQSLLETVIPNIDGPVVIVNGPYRGCRGTVARARLEAFCVDVRLDLDNRETRHRVRALSSRHRAQLSHSTLRGVEYEDVCRCDPKALEVPRLETPDTHAHTHTHAHGHFTSSSSAPSSSLPSSAVPPRVHTRFDERPDASLFGRLPAAVLLEILHAASGGWLPRVHRLRSVCRRFNCALCARLTYLRISPEDPDADPNAVCATGCSRPTNALLAYVASAYAALEELDVAECEGITATGLEPLVSLPRLRALSLSGARAVTDREWRAFALALGPRIESWGLAHSAITNETVRALASASLRYLTVNSCFHLTSQVCGVIAANAPQLEYLNLGYSSVDDAGLAELARCAALTHLDLTACPLVGDDGVRAVFERCAKLETLELLGCPGVTGNALRAAPLARRLRSLELTGTTVAPQEVAALRRECAHLTVGYDDDDEDEEGEGEGGDRGEGEA